MAADLKDLRTIVKERLDVCSRSDSGFNLRYILPAIVGIGAYLISSYDAIIKGKIENVSMIVGKLTGFDAIRVRAEDIASCIVKEKQHKCIYAPYKKRFGTYIGCTVWPFINKLTNYRLIRA